MLRHVSSNSDYGSQFKAATGLPPHQFLITRRVERAQQLLRGRGGLSLAEVAIGVGFSDQSQLCFHFKRIVGVTPGHLSGRVRVHQNGRRIDRNSLANSCG